MRALGLMTRYLFRKLPDRSVLSLMYHSTPRSGAKLHSEYSVSVGRFADQLDVLKESGWVPVTVSQLALPALLPPRAVAITFDDGYRDNFLEALPLLLDRGFIATWFVMSARLGAHAMWLGERTAQTELMGHSEVRELVSLGMEVGSHTRTHPHLDALAPATRQEEIAGSKRELEDLLGRPVTSFAYPYGSYDAATVNDVREAGYHVAVTTRSGFIRQPQPILELPRVTIGARDARDSFARKLLFADNEVGALRLLRYYASRAFDRVRP